MQPRHTFLGILVGAALASTSLHSSAAAGAQAPVRHGSVTIKRDDYGIPNIYADDTYDLFYGYGYALAEDRLFQIESERRTIEGRAAEVFGPVYLPKDEATLANYDYQTLVPQLRKVTGEHRDALDGMVAGIDARIKEVLASRAQLLPKQFTDFGFDPEPWTDLDIAMSWMGQYLFGFADYTSQISNEAFLSDLKAKYDAATAAKIFDSLRWKLDPASPTTIQQIDIDEGRASTPVPMRDPAPHASLLPMSESAESAQARQSILLWNGVGPDLTPHASNAWLVNRPKLADADAVLFNGPQVDDFVPSRIWAASLHGAGLDVTGATYPGLPYFHYGTNGSIAWGRTALAGSILDTYQELTKPGDPHQYRFKGKWLPMVKRTIAIRVKGAQAVARDFYSTVHGPVLIFDDKSHTAYSKKRSWAGHEIDTIFAYFEEMKARNYAEWALTISHKANNQNQYFADVKGNIAYIQAGFYPERRARGYDVQLPSSGAGDMEWTRIQPFSANARVLNPKQGFIDNWNNKPTPGMTNTDTLLWSRLNHVDAITERLEAKPTLTAQEVWNVNQWTSYANENVRYFQPLIRDAARSSSDGRLAELAAALGAWDGQEVDPGHSGVYSAPGLTIFTEWLSEALDKMYDPVLPEKYLGGCRSRTASANCAERPALSVAVLYFALANGKTGSPVPEYDFLRGTKPDDFIRETLAETDKALTVKYGRNIAGWLTPARSKVWETVGPLGDPWSSPGEELKREPDEKRGTMGMFMVFRNGKVSYCDAIPPGESGFVAPDGRKDTHYSDQLTLYTGFDCKPRRVTAQEVDAHTTAVEHLTF
jgi:penicillin amidase